MYDLLIRNARIVDGTGAPWFYGDLAVKDGRIAALGKLSGEATETVDAGGLYLTPGFIDIHSHSDGAHGGKPHPAGRHHRCGRQLRRLRGAHRPVSLHGGLSGRGGTGPAQHQFGHPGGSRHPA